MSLGAIISGILIFLILIGNIIYGIVKINKK
jgi:hypothetical protein